MNDTTDQEVSLVEEGKRFHLAERWQEAEDCYKKVLEINPVNADAIHLIGVMAVQLHQYEVAETIIREAIAINSTEGNFYYNLGLALVGLGRYEEALEAYQTTLRFTPEATNALNNLGQTYSRLGRRDEALECFRKIDELTPDKPIILTNMAAIFIQRKQYDEAIKLLNRAIEIDPKLVPAMYNLALLHEQQKKFAEATRFYEATLEIDPNYVSALNNLGLAYRESQRFDEAERCFERAIKADPSRVDARINLADLAKSTGDLAKAWRLSSEAYDLDPDNEINLTVLSITSLYLGKGSEARQFAERAIELYPNLPDAYGCLGLISMEYADFDLGRRSFDRYIELADDPDSYLSTIAYNACFDPTETTKSIAKRHSEWGEGLTRSVQRNIAAFSPRKPRTEGRYRIGYMSSDFRAHAVSYFMIPILENHDRTEFEIHLISNVAKPDDVTKKFQSMCDGWHDIVLQDNKTAVETIRNLDLDLLVDLTGHTAGSRHRLLAARVARKQASYLGYGFSLGLESIDYLITDNLMVPEDADHDLLETIVRLPSPFLTYEPLDKLRTFDPTPLPALKKGHVTFGYFGRAVRMNDAVVNCWSRILDACPDAILKLDNKSFGDQGVAAYHRARFQARGIDPDRLEFDYNYPPWESYTEIDIALDPFPHNAGTTTLEALWFSCPTVSKIDRIPMGRYGMSILSAIGHPEWVAHSEDEYVEIAAAMAGDLERLSDIRSNLRAELRASRLMRSDLFTRDLENAYRDILIDS